MCNIKITVEYDGSNYCGWQLQKNTDQTIQAQLEKAVSRLNKSPVRVYGAGRTDSGVHALGQTANFKLDVPIPIENIPLAINSELPSDIICKKAKRVSDNFHARYDAVGKKYCYRFSNNRFCSVFNQRFVYNIYSKMNISAMEKIINQIEGCHDFKAFQSSGSDTKNTVRIIKSISLKKMKRIGINNHNEYRLLIEGNGFLYNMVRIIAGTLIEIGLNKRKADLKSVLESKERRQAGFTAPAHGLTLLEVYY